MIINGCEINELTRERIAQMEGDTPTNVMRYWLRVRHPCIDFTRAWDNPPQMWIAKDSLSQAYEIADEIDAKFTRFEGENAKLRELVRDMYGYIENSDCVASCVDFCEHDITDDGCCKNGLCWYENQMRNLGIEVE